MPRFYEQTKRSLAKSITFRITVIVSDLIVIYLFTHRFDITIGVTILTNIASTVLYYIHERVWNIVHWGKVHKKN